MRVLIHEWVTGGGLAGKKLSTSLAAEGGAMRKALIREFALVEGVQVVSTLDERLDEDSGIAETFRVRAGDEESTFSRLARDCDFTLVIAPETDDVLASRAEMIEHVGGRSLGSTPEAIRLTADKLRFAKHLDAAGVRTPPTKKFRTAQGLPRDVRYPAVVKPIDGAGSIHTFIIEDPDQFCRANTLPAEMLIQPYIDGQPLSTSFFMGQNSQQSCLGGGWQTMVLDGPSLQYRGGLLLAPWFWSLGEPIDAVRSVRGLRGWVGVDFLRETDDTSWTILEINPRPTTSLVGILPFYPPGAMARAWLANACGAEFHRPEIVRRTGLRFLADGTILSE